jgi:hypothetical protein
MAEVQRTKSVKAGAWQTLESGWHVSFNCRFLEPAGAQIKIRYGNGWPIGWDSDKQTLDGRHFKTVQVGAASWVYARVQIKVERDFEVTYTYIPTA